MYYILYLEALSGGPSAFMGLFNQSINQPPDPLPVSTRNLSPQINIPNVCLEGSKSPQRPPPPPILTSPISVPQPLLTIAYF